MNVSPIFQNDKLRILIVDDEELARVKLRRLITSCEAQLGAEIIIHEASNGHEALELLEREPVDVVLLDIEMPELSGFDVLRQLAPSEERLFSLIFQTAYDQFALEAFNENACDYIIKPYDEVRVFRALKRAVQKIPKSGVFALNSSSDHQQESVNYRGLINSLVCAKKWLKTLHVKKGNTSHYIPVSDVIAFVADESYTSVLTQCSFRPDETESFLSRISLESLSLQIDPETFFRIHRSAIVNRRFILSLKGYDISMKAGITLQVAKRSRSEFRKWIKAHTS